VTLASTRGGLKVGRASSTGGNGMRPASIVKFERVVLLIILLGLATVVMDYDGAYAPIRRLGYGENFFMAAYALSIAVIVLLLWLIARRASAVAKWIYVVIYAVALVLAALSFSDTLRLPPAKLILQLVQWALTIFSIWLLFRPDASAWFARSDGDGRP
jgi:chromate transport protein ChrA